MLVYKGGPQIREDTVINCLQIHMKETVIAKLHSNALLSQEKENT